MSEGKIIIKNAHCKFFEGQTGLCKAKEFTICNPVNCKLYTIDELSTILDLQEKLQTKELECESLELRFEKLYQFNKKLIAKNFEIGCRNIRYKNLCNEIEEISTTAYCLTNGTNKDMSDFAMQIINSINRKKEENQCEQ